MPEFFLGFDDSGGLEPLVDWGGNPIKGDHPIALLVGFYLRKSAMEEFSSEWNQLRESIQSELEVSTAPPIHMRLMWGKTLPEKYRRLPNPYRRANFEQVQEWVRQCWIIINKYVQKRQAGWFSYGHKRSEAALTDQDYFTDPGFTREIERLRSDLGRKIYKGYHRLATSPLLPLYTHSLLYANTLARTQGPESLIDVLVDPFNDSSGIDEAETVKAMKYIARLEHIGDVDRIQDSDDSVIVQAADLIGFTIFRQRMARLGVINRDVKLDRLVAARNETRLTSANLTHLIRRHYPQRDATLLTMHYAMALGHVRKYKPEYAQNELISVEEFHERAVVARRTKAVGISIFKNGR